MLFIERSLDGLDLAFDATNSIKKLLFFLNRVAHSVSLYTWGSIYFFSIQYWGRGYHLNTPRFRMSPTVFP